MGLVLCPKHGPKGIVFGCPHVAAAVLSASPCAGMERRAYSAKDDPDLMDVELAGWFCTQCVTEFQLPSDETAIADADEFLNRTNALYHPICAQCFQEWREQRK